MTVKITCPCCMGFDWSEATRDNWDDIMLRKPNIENCSYCNNTRTVSLLKHYYTMGKHKEIKRLKRFIKVLEDFKRNKIQNQLM